MTNSPDHPVFDTIMRRRSVRFGFTDAVPDRAVVERIVDAGLAAPSSKNSRPWRLHVVDDKNVIMRIAEAMRSAEEVDTYSPVDPTTGKPHTDYRSTVAASADILDALPLAICIENLGVYTKGIDTLAAAEPEAMRLALVGFLMETIGLGAAIQNLWLAAIEQGLQGVFMGDALVARPAIRTMLGMSGDLVGLIAFGYSDAEIGPPTQPIRDDHVVWH